MVRSLFLATILFAVGFYAGRNYDAAVAHVGDGAEVGQVLVQLLRGPSHDMAAWPTRR